MTHIGQPEQATQNRVIALFRDELGYRYLGDWTDREGNSNIEERLFTDSLTKSGYTSAQISRALYLLKTEADNHSRNLYGNNQAVYKLLRYGVPVKIEAGKVTETVHLINWHEPEKNDFAIAEEITLKGTHERRPDLVMYVNGIAWGLGDVSGKGMNSALLMAKTISLFRCVGKTVHDSAQLLAILNDELAETASRGMFVTMAAGVYNPMNGEILFANAGHQPPLYRSRSGTYRELEESSPPLGILPGMTYTDQRLKLDGGRLYLFTDGVTEGWSAGGGMLEVFGLKALLDKHSMLPPAEQLEHVVEALVRPGVRLRDDLTLLVIG